MAHCFEVLPTDFFLDFKGIADLDFPTDTDVILVFLFLEPVEKAENSCVALNPRFVKLLK